MAEWKWIMRVISLFACANTLHGESSSENPWQEVFSTLGKTAQFSCDIDFSTVVSTTWSRYNNISSQETYKFIATISNGEITKTGENYIDRVAFVDTLLELKNLQLDDTALYYCRSQLVDGRIINGNLIKLTVQKVKIHKVKAKTGTLVTLPCETPHTDYEILNWYRNDSLVPIATKQKVYTHVESNYIDRISFEGKSIIISPCKVSDTAFYQCTTVKDNVELNDNTYVKLTVQEPPSCADAVKSLSTINGTSVLLPCQVQGSPPPTVKWQKLGGGSGALDDRFLVTPKGLYLKHVKNEDAGKYQVTLTNDAATVIESVDLKITSVKPENYEVAKEGERASLPCEKLEIMDGDTIVWKKNGHNVIEKEGGKQDQGRSPRASIIKANGTMVLNPVNRDDWGLYVCSVTTQRYGHEVTITKTMFLNVQYVPSIMHILPMVEVFVGGSVAMPCQAEGNPGVNFRWLLFNGQTIKKSDKFSVSSNGSLVIGNVGIKDAKNYTCAPYSDLGDGEQRHTELVVLSPPEFLTKPPKEVSVLEGKRVVLDCMSAGVPKPIVTWGHDNNNIEDGGRYDIQSIGTLTISDARGSDAGAYYCIVRSKAGQKSRNVDLVVKGKPGTPTQLEVSVQNEIVFARWTRGYSGGTVQSFEIWGRMAYQDDNAWRKIGEIASQPSLPSESKKFQLSTLFRAGDIPQNTKVTFFFSARATNEYGGSGFSKVVKVVILPSEKNDLVSGTRNRFILDKPYPPYNVTVNATRAGYVITWKEKLVPGRPPTAKIVAQYRLRGSQYQWRDYVIPAGDVTSEQSRRRRRRRSATPSGGPLQGVMVKPDDLEGDHIANLEFQVVAESQDGVRSDANTPAFINSAPVIPPSKAPNPNTAPKESEESGFGKFGPVLLGGILGGFAILLLVTVYCLCRKRKKQKYSASKNQQIAFTKENGVNMEHAMEAGYSTDDGDHDEDDETDKVKLLSSLEHDSPRRYHLRTCPALKLGEYTDGADTKSGSGRISNKDPVYFLLQRYEEEKELCTCSNMRYMTLNTHEQQKAKREKKRQQKKTKSNSVNGSIYKSNSSPSLLLTSENDSSVIDPSELLDEEDYDLSDTEKDAVAELNTMNTIEKYPTLKRQKFKDSYDQFCRDGSSSKDPRQRLSSEEKTEVDKHRNFVNMKDVNDVSSENSATESERVITPPKMISGGYEGGDMSDRGGNNRRSKSSGFGDGSNSTSDSESLHHHDLNKGQHHPSHMPPPMSGGLLPPYTNGYMTDTGLHQHHQRRDHGYGSDFSTRSSPLDYKKGRYQQPPSTQRSRYEPQMSNNYYSEDESVRSGHSSALRPVQPPPYTQALHDIERLSEKNDVTDSEDMYDHLLDMGRQLGVSLDDSIESDLNIKGMAPPRSYSNPRAYPPPSSNGVVGGGLESGYMTDNSVGGKDRYTDREKSERCAQLLNEFKSSKSRNTINNNTDTEHDYEDELPVEPPILRSRSVMGHNTAADSEEPRLPPVLRRSNSAGSSGVFKEWLV